MSTIMIPDEALEESRKFLERWAPLIGIIRSALDAGLEAAIRADERAKMLDSLIRRAEDAEIGYRAGNKFAGVTSLDEWLKREAELLAALEGDGGQP